MRVAIISDIHGNLNALKAVITDIENQGAEKLIINGDVVNRGPDSVEVLLYLLEYTKLPTTFILGNHDDLVRLWYERSPKLPPEYFTDSLWLPTANAAQRLAEAGLISVFNKWEMTFRLTTDSMPEVLIAHGTPDNYRGILNSKTPPDYVAEVSARYGVQMLIGSHTHRSSDADFSGIRVLNTGSVGASFDGDTRAAYLLLTARHSGWEAEIRRVVYDHFNFIQRFKSSSMMSGLGADIFLYETIHARSMMTAYINWTTDKGINPNSEASWKAFLSKSAG